jgi:hypothetical protein
MMILTFPRLVMSRDFLFLRQSSQFAHDAHESRAAKDPS